MPGLNERFLGGECSRPYDRPTEGLIMEYTAKSADHAPFVQAGSVALQVLALPLLRHPVPQVLHTAGEAGGWLLRLPRVALRRRLRASPAEPDLPQEATTGSTHPRLPPPATPRLSAAWTPPSPTQQYADSGDLRFGAELGSHAVFADRAHQGARALLADVLTRIGYGADVDQKAAVRIPPGEPGQRAPSKPGKGFVVTDLPTPASWRGQSRGRRCPLAWQGAN